MSTVAHTLKHGVQLHQSGDLQAARQAYESIVRIDRGHADALHLLGVVALQEHRCDEAVQWITGAIAQKPQAAIFHNNLGTAYRGLRDFAHARQSFETSIELDPRYAPGHFNLGLELIETDPDEALACFRRAVELSPAFSAAQDALGTLLLKRGETAAAVAALRRAVETAPTTAEFAFNLANALSADGDVEAAIDVLRRAAELAPDSVEIHNNLGALLKQQGRYEDAIAALRRALTVRPNHVDTWINLGRTYLLTQDFRTARDRFADALRACGPHAGLLAGLGKAHHYLSEFDDAAKCLLEAIERDPRQPDAYFDLAAIRLDQDDLPATADCYERGLALCPDHQTAWETLAGVYTLQQELEQAAACYQRALALDPANTKLLMRLAETQRTAGLLTEAKANYEKLVELEPKNAHVWNNFGNLMSAQERLDDAREFYERALELDPNLAAGYCNLAATVSNLGELDHARRLFQKSLAIRPDARIRVQTALSLPPVYRDLDELQDERGRLSDEIDRLLADEVALDPAKQLVPNVFYLAYQGYNDRELLERISRLYRSSHQPEFTARASGSKIHIGFLSRHFKDHTIAIFMMGLMARLPRDTFHVSILSPTAHADRLGTCIRNDADQYVVLTDDVPTAVRRTCELQLDLLFYTDIGMDPYSYTLANSRLAPVQCLTWGHPVTSGLDTVDYFVSSDLIEISGAQSHYTEHLVRLATLPSYYHKPHAPELLKQRHHYGLPEHGGLYLCPQSVFKLHPEFDQVLAGILARDPGGRIVLIEGHHSKWTVVLNERLRRTLGNDFDRLHFLKRMPTSDFHNLMAICDVMLDPLHFGGGSTNYEGLAFGMPIVTLPSPYLRTRGAVGLYNKIQLTDCVANSAEEYIDRAVRLATDDELNRQMRRRIRDANWVLFEEASAVEQFSEFLTYAVERNRSGLAPQPPGQG